MPRDGKFQAAVVSFRSDRCDSEEAGRKELVLVARVSSSTSTLACHACLVLFPDGATTFVHTLGKAGWAGRSVREEGESAEATKPGRSDKQQWLLQRAELRTHSKVQARQDGGIDGRKTGH